MKATTCPHHRARLTPLSRPVRIIASRWRSVHERGWLVQPIILQRSTARRSAQGIAQCTAGGTAGCTEGGNAAWAGV